VQIGLFVEKRGYKRFKRDSSLANAICPLTITQLSYRAANKKGSTFIDVFRRVTSAREDEHSDVRGREERPKRSSSARCASNKEAGTVRRSRSRRRGLRRSCAYLPREQLRRSNKYERKRERRGGGAGGRSRPRGKRSARDGREGSETKRVARAVKVTGRSRGLYVRSRSRISLRTQAHTFAPYPCTYACICPTRVIGGEGGERDGEKENE